MQSMFKNDYCQNFVDTGERPQNFIRDILPEERFTDYPKLNELIKLKDKLIKERATPPMYIKSDIKGLDIKSLGKFDVILMDPPWEEYYRRRLKYDIVEPYWSLDEIASIPIDEVAEACSFLFLWVGSENLEAGRILFRKWGFKRCEDIVWLKTNKNDGKDKRMAKKNQAMNDPTTVLQRVKEHCLVGLKGDVRRASDSYFIHANIDTDVIVDEEPPFGGTEKPKEIYQIIERFCLGRKRLELFGGPSCIRAGWLTVGNDIYETNYDGKTYASWFENDRYLGTSNEIETLRPKSPKSTTNPALKDDLPTKGTSGQSSGAQKGSNTQFGGGLQRGNSNPQTQQNFHNMGNMQSGFGFHDMGNQGNMQMGGNKGPGGPGGMQGNMNLMRGNSMEQSGMLIEGNNFQNQQMNQNYMGNMGNMNNMNNNMGGNWK